MFNLLILADPYVVLFVIYLLDCLFVSAMTSCKNFLVICRGSVGCGWVGAVVQPWGGGLVFPTWYFISKSFLQESWLWCQKPICYICYFYAKFCPFFLFSGAMTSCKSFLGICHVSIEGVFPAWYFIIQVSPTRTTIVMSETYFEPLTCHHGKR